MFDEDRNTTTDRAQLPHLKLHPLLLLLALLEVGVRVHAHLRLPLRLAPLHLQLQRCELRVGHLGLVVVRRVARGPPRLFVNTHRILTRVSQ